MPNRHGAARAGREEHVAVDDLLAGHPAGLETLQELDQMADHEIGRIALTVVAELLAELKRRHIGGRQHLDLVPGRLEHGLDQLLVLPGQSPDEHRDPVSFGRREGALHGPLEVIHFRAHAGQRAQPLALGGDAPGDLLFDFAP
jgi:hypothetical protein